MVGHGSIFCGWLLRVLTNICCSGHLFNPCPPCLDIGQSGYKRLILSRPEHMQRTVISMSSAASDRQTKGKGENKGLYGIINGY